MHPDISTKPRGTVRQLTEAIQQVTQQREDAITAFQAVQARLRQSESERREAEEQGRLWRDISRLYAETDGKVAVSEFSKVSIRIAGVQSQAAFLRRALARLLREIGEPIQASPPVMLALREARFALEHDDVGRDLTAALIALDQAHNSNWEESDGYREAMRGPVEALVAFLG